MGILPTLVERGYLIDRLSMVNARGREVAGLDVAPLRAQLHGRFVSIARADLSAALFGACDGIPARFGVSITGVRQDAHGAVALCSDGQEERFDLVVGADGLHSRVRDVLGLDATVERPLGCHVAAFRLSDYPHRDELTYVSHTVPGRQVARVALRGGETLILMICRSEFIAGDPARNRHKETVRRAFGDMRWEVPEILSRMTGVDDVYFDRVSQIHLERWSAGRVALVGDAAACASFLAGEGTGLAMIEAYVLAGEIHRGGADLARGLAAYEARLRPFVEEKQHAAVGFRGFFVPRNALALGLRNVAVRLMSIPLLSRRWIARSIVDRFELPAYERG